jgi:hypothetical protein
MAVANVMHIVAVEIQKPPPLRVFDVSTICAGYRRQAGRGYGLLQEVPRVFIEKAQGVRVMILPGPQLAPGGCVYLPFTKSGRVAHRGQGKE